MLPKQPPRPKSKAKKKPKTIQRAPAKKARKVRGGSRTRAERKPEKAEAPPLTPDAIFEALPLKQQNFIVNYLANGFNGTNAAKDAGFSAKTADSQASRLLKNDKVRAVIAARSRRALSKREITAERVLDEIAKLAFFDPRRFYDAAGGLIPIHELDEECGAALAGVNVTELYADKAPIGQLRKIKFADKGQNLERLGRHLKLFTDKVQHEHKITRVVVREALKEPRKLPPSEPEFD
jgi:phage terminase small subunit